MAAADTVLNGLKAYLRRFARPAPLLVALSGGSDSTCLLAGLSRLVKSEAFSGFSLHAVTVDHGLRQGSAEEAHQAAALCARLQIPHAIVNWTGPKPETGLQAAARSMRYRLLVEEAMRVKACAVITGHTATDQRETIAMRAARGPGDGLSGMAEETLLDERIWLHRPLLGLERPVLRDALCIWGETWLEDPSNENTRFERVRVRNAVVSNLPSVQSNRAQQAALQADWLDTHARVLAGAVAIITREGLFSTLPGRDVALFRLSSAIGGKPHLPASTARKRLLDHLETAAPGRLTLGGTVFDLRREALYLYREKRGLHPQLMLSGEGLYDGRYRLCGKAGARALLQPTADATAAAAMLEREGVPQAIAKRAAVACVEIAGAGAGQGLWLERRIAAHVHFLPGFDLKVAESLRRHFGLPSLPEGLLLPASLR